MKKLFTFFVFAMTCASLTAQEAYWVFLADKQGSTFDPYTYFDAKAIERYRQCGADLYDQSNYPLAQQYVDGVDALATEEIGCSRWMNAMGIMATPEQIAAIEQLPYVLRVQAIEGNGMLLSEYSDYSEYSELSYPLEGLFDRATVDGPLEAQLVRMGGQAFRDKGIDGKGIRIAVFDGGFPRVNTHEAFRHLRENHQIIKTWNFPRKKENVYGWNSHGTMTLSCIAGRMNGVDLGLATGAEFLLARTEVNSEPFKEEVWWQMAVEWADKNGANIISSSLGYGKERHYTKDMDGTSYVAKAGNLAARKGMLVVNSAGNEADDNQWKTIITPSDADSVLCIGGIENSLTEYNHIEFSSYGPSADGRLKPNVCAFGYARTANVKGDDVYHYVHGTSFSCPLVAGFAACAWQASPGKTAMEMFRLIEQSGDLYPYYDYAFGYGVPQARYFATPGALYALPPTIRLDEQDGTVTLSFTKSFMAKSNGHIPALFFKEETEEGRIVQYEKMNISAVDTDCHFTFATHAGRRIVAHFDGYTVSHTVKQSAPEYYFGRHEGDGTFINNGYEYRTPKMNEPSEWGSCAKWRTDYYFGLGLPIKTASAELTPNVWSPDWNFGLRVMRAFSKSYSLGLGFGYHGTHYRFNDQSINDLENMLGVTQAGLDTYEDIDTRSLWLTEVQLELFQRVRLIPGGLTGKGTLYWDLGIYGSYAENYYELSGYFDDSYPYGHSQTTLSHCKPMSDHEFNFGALTRIGYDFVSLYARYRLNGIGSDVKADKVLLPRLTIGLQLLF